MQGERLWRNVIGAKRKEWWFSQWGPVKALDKVVFKNDLIMLWHGRAVIERRS